MQIEISRMLTPERDQITMQHMRKCVSTPDDLLSLLFVMVRDEKNTCRTFRASWLHSDVYPSLLHMPATFSFLQRWFGVLPWTVWTIHTHQEPMSLSTMMAGSMPAHPYRISFRTFLST